MDTNIYKLNNGLRVVIQPALGAVSYIGLAVNAGSRDEAPDKEGLAHFVEHTIFKGTDRRSSWHISNRMESVGGELNAYTSKEETLIYTNAPAGYADRALELLGDLVANSRFPAAELEKEREVVVEEINSYLDSPGDSVFDEFEELIYAGSGLAHNILGTPDSVRQLRSEDCRAFLDHHYTPANMVLYIVDSGCQKRLLRLAEKHFGHLHYQTVQSPRITPPPTPRFDLVRDRDGHQAHTILGARMFSRDDPRRYALFLLNNYLGGPSMNSLLNQELRDRRGLVYAVESMVSLMSDAGLLEIYFGSDRESEDKCLKVTRRVLDSLAQNHIRPRTLEKIKEQYCGQLIVSTDQRESKAMALGKSVLYYGGVHDTRMVADAVRQVSAEQLREVAELLAPDLCSRLTLK